MARRFVKHQIEPLKEAFEASSHLNRKTKMELAAATGLDVEQIASWFNRKRARTRARDALAELEVAHVRLQQELDVSRVSEAELQKEIQESRSREAGLEEENRRLKQRVAIAEGDRQLMSLMRFLNG
ncbi:homeobox-leucine zipper protein ATHB-23-like [Salvia divinorum]|uniref:Homeobox-leucine zipper protein n=1 Tax=Salvia divinorum TaxID=28513 RepID=A0ABD1GD66_SALDI